MIRGMSQLLIIVACFATSISCDSTEPATSSPTGASPLAARLKMGPGFRFEELPIRSYNLFDLCIVDVDQDGWLDLFTVNHNARSSLLMNQQGQGFVESLEIRGLGHSPSFPGIEDTAADPPTRDGVHVFFRNKKLFVRSRGVTAADSVVITIRARCNFDGEAQPRESFRWSAAGALPSDPKLVTTTIRVRGDGILALKPSLLGVHYEISVTGSLADDGFLFGADALPAAGRRLDFVLRDRHGAAWFDVDEDDASDVFIGRGGLKGQIASGGHVVEDELLACRAAGFEGIGGYFGLRKGATRNRQVAAADFDGDGSLDLVMGNNGPMKVLRRANPRSFIDVTKKWNLDSSYDCFRALDIDDDGDTDIVAANRTHVALELRDGDRFRKRVLLETSGKVEAIAPADYDEDGNWDLFVAGRSNLLLRNALAASSSAGDATRLGLPKTSLAAAWVDFDDDGRLDLFTVPQGLFRQEPDHSFSKTGLLATGDAYAARVTWFDADNDGDRDMALAVQWSKDALVWSVGLIRNDTTGEDTTNDGALAIDLRGQGNIALGAKVTVSTSGGKKIRRRVGESESSHFSQGHYRVYFGLGAETVTGIEVAWPDGATEKHEGPKALEPLITITRTLPLRH